MENRKEEAMNFISNLFKRIKPKPKNQFYAYELKFELSSNVVNCIKAAKKKAKRYKGLVFFEFNGTIIVVTPKSDEKALYIAYRLSTKKSPKSIA